MVAGDNSQVKLILCVQYYACASSQRQHELDLCLEANLNHPAIGGAFVWVEPSAPALPRGAAAVERIPSEHRLTYGDWLRLSQRQSDAILLLANADIRFTDGLEFLSGWLPTARHGVALSRHEPEATGEAILHPHPHWSQDSWAIRSDAPIDASLLHASAIPLGMPGCDNRFAHVLWSHGFSLSNPCHHIGCLHHHAGVRSGYDQAAQRLFGACTYVHPALAPGEPSELEHAIWTRSQEDSGGLTLQREGEQAEAWPYRRLESPASSSFGHRQRLRQLLEQGRPLGSQDIRAHASRQDPDGTEELALSPSTNRILLPVTSLLAGEIELEVESSPVLLALAVAFPPSQGRAPLRLQSRGPGHDWSDWGEADGLTMAQPPAPQRLISPPFPRQVSQLRLAMARTTGEADQATETSAGYLELQWIVAMEPALLAPESPQAPQKLASFGNRFEVIRQGGQLHWVDRFWPWSHRAAAAEGSAPLIHEREQLFRRGFVRPLLEWKVGLIRAAPNRSNALLVWDQLDGTEERAWFNHARLEEPLLKGDTCELYVGLPWANFARLNRAPWRLIEAYGARIRAITEVLASMGRQLAVHTVCQHRQWQQQIPLFQAAGISDLWLCHKPRGIDHKAGLRLHAWPLLPMGAPSPGGPWEPREPSPHVPWEQRTGTASGVDNRLDQRRFCLCSSDPEADPSRLWQSLASGCLAVIEGEEPELPQVPPVAEASIASWEEVVIFTAATDRQELEDLLAAISPAEAKRRQMLGMQRSELASQMTCFQSR